MKKTRVFLSVFVVAVCLFLQSNRSNASVIPTTIIFKVAGSQPFVAFQRVTFTVTVNPIPNGGFVAFQVGNSGPIGIAVNSSGRAVLTTGFLPGATSIKANYDGFGNFGASPISTLVIQVVKAWTGTNLTATATNISYGDLVTFKASVAALSPSAPSINNPLTGTLTFYDGSAKMAFGTLTNGTVSFSLSLLTPGTHYISAQYGGDSNFEGSVSPQTIVVTVS